MQTIKFNLSDDLAKALAARAKERGLSSEAFAKMVTEEVLSRSEAEFASALAFVLSKNAELYDRLAR